MSALPPVRLRVELFNLIGAREWGLPTGLYVGKLWRSDDRATVSCILPVGRSGQQVRVETREWEPVYGYEREWIPASWRDAAWRYVVRWPDSGYPQMPFVRATRAQVVSLVQREARQIAQADALGALGIAYSLGQIAGNFPRLGEP